MNFAHEWRIGRWTLFGAALAVSNIAAAASTCFAPWGAVETISSKEEVTSEHDIGVDQSGQVTVVWAASLDKDSGDKILFARQRNANGVWQPTQELHRLKTVYNPSAASADVRLGVSPNGHAMVLWTRSFNAVGYAVAVRFDPVLGWGAVENLMTDDMSFARARAAKVNNSGQALVAMRNSDHVYYRQFDPATGWGALGAFAMQGKDELELPGVSAAINEAGQAVLAWPDRSPVVAVFDPIRQWSKPVRFPSKGEQVIDSYGSQSPVVSLDQSGEVFLAWETQTDKPNTQPKKWKIYANRRDPVHGWGVPEVLSVPDKNGLGPTLATSSGRTVLVYQEGDKYATDRSTRTMMRRYQAGAGWQAQIDVTAPPAPRRRVAAGYNPVVELSPEGDISILQINQWLSFDSFDGDLLQSSWDSTPTLRARTGRLGHLNEYALSSARVQAVAKGGSGMMVRLRDCTQPSSP